MGADVVSEVLGLRGRDALSPMFLVNEVERGLPLSALDRVAKAVAQATRASPSAWSRARHWPGAGRRWPRLAIQHFVEITVPTC